MKSTPISIPAEDKRPPFDFMKIKQKDLHQRSQFPQTNSQYQELNDPFSKIDEKGDHFIS